MYPYLTKKRKTNTEVPGTFKGTHYFDRNKILQILQICLIEFIIELLSCAFFFFCYYNELILQTLKTGLQLQRMSHFS